MHSEERTRQTFNRLKRYYDETWDPKQHTLHVGIFRPETKTLRQAYAYATNYLLGQIHKVRPFTKESNVLDVGCGSGKTLLDLCKRHECSGVGIDLSDAQIRSARTMLHAINEERRKKGKPRLRCHFIRGSGSNLQTLLRGQLFTHIMSQDALFLVVRKLACYRQIFRHLVPEGVFATTDFLEERRGQSRKILTHRVVNWKQGLSFQQYKTILQSIGFSVLRAEQRNQDMIKTYTLLGRSLQRLLLNNDSTYRTLFDRYHSIVNSVRKKHMGWGMFVAQKPADRTILLTGTKPHSLSRVIGKLFHKHGWDVWLYSRHTRIHNSDRWHERRCDVTSTSSIKWFLLEMPRVDIAVQLADTGGHGDLETLKPSHSIVHSSKTHWVGHANASTSEKGKTAEPTHNTFMVCRENFPQTQSLISLQPCELRAERIHSSCKQPLQRVAACSVCSNTAYFTVNTRR